MTCGLHHNMSHTAVDTKMHHPRFAPSHLKNSELQWKKNAHNSLLTPLIMTLPSCVKGGIYIL